MSILPPPGSPERYELGAALNAIGWIPALDHVHLGVLGGPEKKPRHDLSRVVRATVDDLLTAFASIPPDHDVHVRGPVSSTLTWWPGDADCPKATHLVIDIDPAKGAPRSVAWADVQRLAGDVCRVLWERRHIRPLVLSSGNGIHLVIRIGPDVDADGAETWPNRSEREGFLAALKTRVPEYPGAHLDPNTWHAGQGLRLPWAPRRDGRTVRLLVSV